MTDGTAQNPALNRKPDTQLIGAKQLWSILRNRRGRSYGLCIKQHFGISVARRIKNLSAGSSFHHFPLAHHDHTISDFTHDAQVMRDEQKAQPLTALQISQELQNLCLNRHIKGGGGLIGDQQLRLIGQGHCDHHPLPLPT